MLGWTLFLLGDTAASLTLTVAFSARSFAFVMICVLVVVWMALRAMGFGCHTLPSHAVDVFRRVYLSRNGPKMIDVTTGPNPALVIDDAVGGNRPINKRPDVTVGANEYPINTDVPIATGILASTEDVARSFQIGFRTWLLVIVDNWWRSVRAFEAARSQWLAIALLVVVGATEVFGIIRPPTPIETARSSRLSRHNRTSTASDLILANGRLLS